MKRLINWPKQRAWGWYATFIRTPWFCFKLLRFAPYKSLSHQKHFHRKEVWFFLKGAGKIKINFQHSLIWKRRFWVIDKEDWHTFTAFDKPVYALELQYGRKVTEEDIERR